MISGIVASLVGGAALSWLRGNLMVIAISAVAVGLTGLVAGGYGYLSGYNSARAKCQTATLKRQIAELQRDRDVQKITAESNAARVRVLEETANKLDQRVADYEAELAKRPANASCALTDDDIRRLRPNRRR